MPRMNANCAQTYPLFEGEDLSAAEEARDQSEQSENDYTTCNVVSNGTE